jgi:hypothetical protein
MAKLLRFKESDWKYKENDFALFVVTLQDDQGNEYEWAPKWVDLADIFTGAPMTEELNEGRAYLEVAEAALRTLATIINSVHGKGTSLQHPAARPDGYSQPFIYVKLEDPCKPEKHG